MLPFEMCCFQMGIAQIAFDLPPCQTGTVEHFFQTLFLSSVFIDIAKIKKIKKGLPLRTEQFKNAF